VVFIAESILAPLAFLARPRLRDNHNFKKYRLFEGSVGKKVAKVPV